jgi:1-acyl-sn-glycerol-3-phosphate acyltransferase
VRFGRGLTVPLLRAGFALRVDGAQHLAARGPLLLAANHLSFLDPVVLQAACPRPIHYLMTARLHSDRRWQWLFRLFDTVPVAMGSGNFLALKRAAERLQAGEVVGVFPEGGISRDGTLGPFRPGVALLAARTGVPVVPVRIEGTREALPPGAWRPRRPDRGRRYFGPSASGRRWPKSARSSSA